MPIKRYALSMEDKIAVGAFGHLWVRRRELQERDGYL